MKAEKTTRVKGVGVKKRARVGPNKAFGTVLGAASVLPKTFFLG